MVITKIQSAVSARFLTTLLFAGFALVGCKEKGSDTPAECVDGTQDCPCLPDGGCDPAQPQLVCNASNVCVDPGSPDPGELNGACDETIACSTYEEEQLECINGTCQLPDCLSGLVGCPCAGALSCDDPAVEGEVCIEGICQLEGCTPGSLGCACDEGDVCQSGLECASGVCRSAAGVWLTVSDATVRACDVLLSENGGRVALVNFQATVLGETMSRTPRTAVSFAARADATLVGDVARVELVNTVAGAGVTIESATCFNALGQPVAGTPVSVR